MSAIARRFRVKSWTHAMVDNPEYAKAIEEGIATPERNGVYPVIAAAPTQFNVDLVSLDMDGVEVSHGSISLTLNTSEALTGENYAAIRTELLNRGVLSDGGLLDMTSDNTLEGLKAQRWEVISGIRDGLEIKGFPYLNKWFDSDERSTARINTMAQAAMAAAMLGQDFSTEWVCADNTTISMTRDEIIGLPVAFAQYGGILHEKARSLRQRIESAKSGAEVSACVWEGVEAAPLEV